MVHGIAPFLRWRLFMQAGAVLSAGAGANHAPAARGECTEGKANEAEGVSLIAIRGRAGMPLSRVRATEDGQKCSPLDNHGTHFTVDIKVGTPEQTFATIVDTGSNSLIVPSCVCRDSGYCNAKDRCFRGTNKSSSFYLDPNGGQIVLTFGSGSIEGAVARELVRIDGVSANMTDGLLLMTDQTLDFGGPFEGILGLGPPQALAEEESEASKVEDEAWDNSTYHGNASSYEEEVQKMLKDIFGDDAYGDNWSYGDNEDWDYRGDNELIPERMVETNHSNGNSSGTVISVPLASNLQMPLQFQQARTVIQPSSFLEQANIKRFSMCFNDGATGVLRFDPPKLGNALDSIGTEHWGLGLEGISVGGGSDVLTIAPLDTWGSAQRHNADSIVAMEDGAAAVNGTVDASSRSLTQICTRENMTKEQKTPCGAIPDSGTTLIVAPQTHIDVLMELICDRWPRCSSNYTALKKAGQAAKRAAEKIYGVQPFDIDVVGKSVVLELLLADCEHWLKESNLGLGELPHIHFHVSGNKTKQTLTLPGHSYVIESIEEDQQYTYENVEGWGDIPVGINKTGKTRTVCEAAFGPMEYNTVENGPVWILGTPLFYQYTVGYDLSENKVAFTSVEEEPCGSCENDVGFVTSKVEPANKKKRMPRRQHGKPRMPSFDVSKPL